MRNQIEVDTEVVVLHCQFLMRGVCTKVNEKTYKVKVPAQRLLEEFEKNFSKDRVASIEDRFAVVWDTDRGPNGSYRIEFDLYEGHHNTYQAWAEPYMYIKEDNKEL